MVSRTPSRGHGDASVRSSANLREALRILFRHKRKMLAFFVTTMTLVVLGVIFFPRSYLSEARLFVRLGKESVGLDPTATLSQTVNVDGNRESEINSEVEILRSRVLFEDVVDALGADYVLGRSDEATAGWADALMTPVSAARDWLAGNVSERERAVTRLEKNIYVGASRKSNVIGLTCRGSNPEQAQKVLQAYLDSYLNRHVLANRTHGSHEFFVDQSELLREQLSRANEELRDLKNSIQMVSIEGQQQNVQAQAQSIEAAILENERALAHSEAKVVSLKKTLGELPPELMAEETAGLPNPAADAMRNELYKLQILEKEASSRFTSLHPTVIALRRQVADTQKILDEQQNSRSQTTRKLSVVHQSVQTELMAAQALAAAQRAEAESLKQQYNGVRTKIQALNDNEFRVTELMRRRDLLEATYRNYVTNREQARVDEELASGRISNVNVVQAATYVAKPASPRILLALQLGFIAASVGAVLVAFIAEHLDPSVKTSGQVEQELGIPVLLSVPRNGLRELLHN
jgi:uncharacterized protein involved in exopolysaccharide biosynthesis